MRKKIIIYILVCMLVFPTVLGVVSSSNTEVVKSLSKVTVGRDYSHTIFGESFTSTTCEYCKFQHRALKNIYKGGWHPFYYLSLIFDVNKHAEQRKNELNIQATPAVAWDGGYRRDVGASGVEEAMNRYNTSIILCGNRDVADIDLTLNVTWLGAVNPNPYNAATGVPIEHNMSWTVTAMNIGFTVDNNEASQYSGHLHIYVTEINSSYWKDKFGDPYTFAFLDYAFNGNVSISAGDTLVDSETWDGADYSNGYGEFFDEIYQENAMVIASVFDGDTDYTDETAGFRAGIGTDPKRFDIYFGNTTPPPKVMSNTTYRIYNPPGNLEFNTTYYWKIDTWDNKGNPKYGPIWSFTTRPNNPPNTPYNPTPTNNSINVPICTNISWYGGDPDYDSVTYDVFFGSNPLNLEKVSSNQTATIYDPSQYENLDFNTKYYWKIVAWDEYGLSKSSPLWNFRTQVNLPPNPPSDPFPYHGASNVPITGVILRWNGSDPNPCDTLKYNVYFGKDDPTPDLVSENQTSSTYELEDDLILFETYYWQIVAFDSGGLSTSSPVWSFTTGINDPPTTVITGPTHPRTGKDYDYHFTATDPNGDDVYLWISWGDGSSAVEWIGPYPSDEEITLNHTWAEEGTYTIKAKAKDTYGAEGELASLKVTAPLNMQSSQQSLKALYLKTLKQLLNLHLNLTKI